MPWRPGHRPNAGRKPKAVEYEAPIKAAEAKIIDKLPHLLDRMLELADGIQLEGEAPQGGKFIYTRAPDRAAISYLVDRILGKATEHVELDADMSVSVVAELDEVTRAKVRAALLAPQLPALGPPTPPAD